MKKPLVSVVMVTCNVERFLAEAIDSILNQSCRDFEFVIVDFGSTDRSMEIIANYAAKDSRVKLHQAPHCALPAARNAACALAHGQYLAVMDADDVAAPDRLKWEIDFMERNPEVGLLGGATEWIDAAGRVLRQDRFPAQDREIKAALEARFPFCHPTALIRKEAFALAGGYRPAFVVAHDYDLFLRISEHYRCANLEEVVLRYRIHPYQVSMHKRRQQTICKIAAAASASARRSGNPDPLDSTGTITSQTLLRLGVSETRLVNDVAAELRQWIRHMRLAGEHSAALNAAVEFLRSDLTQIEAWQVADLRLTVASVYWSQSRFMRSLVAAGRALATRPAAAARPFFKRLMRRSRP
jgi:glycosyltransferase involved in cell wall biosynthesis